MKLFLSVLIIAFGSVATGQTNDALSFDGTNKFVSVPHDASLNLTNFSFEAWINLTTTSGALTILSKGEGVSAAITNYIFNVGAGSGNGKLGLFAGGAWYSANTTLGTGTWYHAAVTVSGTAVQFYLNGVADGTAILSGAMYTGGTYLFKIGEQGDGCDCNTMNGKIDEVRIWNIARTQAEIRANMFNKNLSNSASGLIAYYRFNEGSGITTANSSTNSAGIDGTLVNNPSWQTSPIEFSANALNFDGVDDIVVIPHVVSSDFTVEFLMKTSSTGPAGTQWYNGNGIVDAEVGGVTNDWGTALIGSKLGFGIGNTDITIKSLSNVNTGNWIHIAASWKQSTGAMKLYINGTLEASTTGSTNLRNVPPRITFGELQTNINRFNGSLDEVRLWNVERTLAQVQADMNKELDPSLETNLLAYYTFNEGIASGTNTGLTTLVDQKNSNNGTMSNMALTGATSNFIAQNAGLIVLPLQWLTFKAQGKDKHVLLAWSTANEQNTNVFHVQHSNNGSTWQDIGVVHAAGGNAVNNYSYVHDDPANGPNYYRIEETDFDGHSSYSETKIINIATANFDILNNPVLNGMLQVRLTTAARLQLYNDEGKLMWHKNVSAGVITIDMNHFSKGTYLVKIDNHTSKIILR